MIYRKKTKKKNTNLSHVDVDLTAIQPPHYWCSDSGWSPPHVERRWGSLHLQYCLGCCRSVGCRCSLRGLSLVVSVFLLLKGLTKGARSYLRLFFPPNVWRGPNDRGTLLRVGVTRRVLLRVERGLLGAPSCFGMAHPKGGYVLDGKSIRQFR